MRKFLVIVTLLVDPAWAQEGGVGSWKEPDLLPSGVEPTFVDQGGVKKVKPPGSAEKAKEKVLQGYEDWRQKMANKKEEAKPKWWEGFLQGGSRPRPLFPQSNITATAFSLLVMLILMYFVKGLALWIARLTKWPGDDRPFVIAVVSIFGIIVAYLLRGIILSVPGVGYLFREIGVWGHLACWIMVLLIQWKLGCFNVENGGGQQQPQQGGRRGS